MTEHKRKLLFSALWNETILALKGAAQRIKAALALLQNGELTREYGAYEIRCVENQLKQDLRRCYSNDIVHRGTVNASLTYLQSDRNHSQSNRDYELFYSALHSDGTLSIKYSGSAEWGNSMYVEISFSKGAIRSLLEAYCERSSSCQ